MGKIFQDGYTTGADKKKVAQLIKEQLSYTRTKLHENIHEMQGAFTCIRYNQDCHGLNFDKVMAKTPAPDLSGVFSKDQIERIQKNPSEIDSLSSDQKKALKKDMFTLSQFDTLECIQKAREDVSEVRKELGFLAVDVGLAIATVGLGSAAIAGKLAFRAVGHVSKAQRLQNLGLMGVDITFSVPYIDKAIDDCGDYMNELERTASEETNNVCRKLPVRSKLTSDLKSCLLTASLASLPLAVPALAVAGRAGFKALTKGKSPTPKDPTPSAQPKTPSERQIADGTIQSRTSSTPQERKRIAERVLGKDLSDEQVQAIEHAHRIGNETIGRDRINPAEIGNYTAAQLREKVRILIDAGFSQDERSELIRSGVVGRRNKKQSNRQNQPNKPQTQGGGNTPASTVTQITEENISKYLAKPDSSVQGTEEVRQLLDKPTSRNIRKQLSARINQILNGNMGNVENIGDFSELKWMSRGGLRVYFKKYNGKIYILNIGDKKSGKGSQNRDIRSLQRKWDELKKTLD